MPYRLTELFPSIHQERGPYVRPKKLNVFLVDVSGSMGWCMRQLVEDISVRILKIPKDDGLVVGIFSSPGFYKWVVSSVLNSQEMYDNALRDIREAFYERNTTCFSEILAASVDIFSLWSHDYPVITCTFMSDGCPVVPSLAIEDAAITKAVKDMAPYITSGVVVAYGDYADMPRLTAIASGLGVELVTANTVQHVGEAFQGAVEKPAKKRRKVRMPSGVDFAFTLDSDGNVSHVDVKKGELFVSEDAVVYKTTGKIPSYSVPAKNEHIEYAFALALLQQRRFDDAVNVLANLGDVHLTNLVNSVTTNSEVSRIESCLREAIVSPKARFLKGKMVGCVPKENAFDLFDLLQLLTSDPLCRFYPHHPAFAYKRIGRSSVIEDGFPIFQPYDIAVPLSRIVGHSSELNLSVGVSIPGYVTLPPYVNAGGRTLVKPDMLPEQYKTHIFRNYALVANALLQVTRLPVIVGDRVQDMLERQGMVEDRDTPNDVPIVLDLTRIPLCNKKRGLDACDWGHLADLAMRSLRLGSIAKVLREERKKIDPERLSELPVEMTEKEWEFLSACGIKKDGSYSPPTIAKESTDVLTIRTFELLVEHSSPVSVKEMQRMIEGKRRWNIVGEMMCEGAQLIQKEMPSSKAEALTWLHEQIEEHERLKRQVDMDINSRRFAVALTGAWPRHFSQDDIWTASKDGYRVQMRFREIEKKI